MSDWYQIESGQIVVQVESKGAEIRRLFNKFWNTELLWPGAENIWNRSAPILFPIVGKLKNNQYQYSGNSFTLSQHGFARDAEFNCLRCDGSSILFSLKSNIETKKIFPFDFELQVKYELVEDQLDISYKVINSGNSDLLFSIGSHPGFQIKNLTNSHIEFEKIEKEYFGLDSGLVDLEHPMNFNKNKLMLEPNLFKDDAIIFKDLKSNFVDLVDTKSRQVIRVGGIQKKYLGIWGKEQLPFVCIEPWAGLSDTLNHNGNFEEKVGILKLAPLKEYDFKYFIKLLTIPTVMD
jgi:galactose mutarotase-like enzyme